MAAPRSADAPPRRGFDRRARAMRVIENAAKWLSGGVGALVLVGYSLIGVGSGDLSAVLVAVGVGGVLLGWVLAVRRLDAGLRALRERLSAAGARQAPTQPPAAS